MLTRGDVDLEGQQQAAHCAFSSFSNGIVVMTSATRRKMASPNSTPTPSGQKATATPMATTARMLRRTIVNRVS